MNKDLRTIFDKSMELFEKDPRILSAWHYGSIARGISDEYSDVDPVILVKKDFFEQVDEQLPAMFQRICPKIHLWWPESFNDHTIRNYAILLESGQLCQYDLTIVRESCLDSGMAGLFSKDIQRENIIFDKYNTLEDRIVTDTKEKADTPANLSFIKNQIEMYWLFAFISTKYFMRGDIFKIIYARDIMRSVHLAVLKLLSNKGDWSWWPESINKNLEPQKQAELLSYFGAPTLTELKRNFMLMLNAFSKDAQELCRREKTDYPGSLEAVILKHIYDHLHSEERQSRQTMAET